MNFRELAEKRYSCRKFTDKKVEKDLMEKIVETALKSPTAVNFQPFKIFMMESEEAKEIIRKVTNYTFGADNFLVLGAKKDEAWVRSFDNYNYADVDASIVGTHIMLETYDLGLATTWVGHFDVEQLKKLCPAMKDYNLLAIFPIGYADTSEKAGQPIGLHYKQRAKEEVVEVL